MNPIEIDEILENHLLAMPQLPPVAWDDVSFTPVLGTPYFQVNQLRNDPIEYGEANDLREDRGIFQITVCAPGGKGKVHALSLAHKIAQHFVIGTVFERATFRVFLNEHASIHTGISDDGWYRVPVSIEWQALPV